MRPKPPKRYVSDLSASEKVLIALVRAAEIFKRTHTTILSSEREWRVSTTIIMNSHWSLHRAQGPEMVLPSSVSGIYERK